MKFFNRFKKPVINDYEVICDKPTIKEEYGLPPLHAAPPEEELEGWSNTFYDSDTQIHYIKIKVDDHYMWKVDQEKMDKIASDKAAQNAEIKYKQDLAIALQSRIISDEEMLKVMEYGFSLFGNLSMFSVIGYNSYTTYSNGDYNISSSEYYEQLNYLQKTFNEALLQQFKLRTVKEAVEADKIVQTIKSAKKKK